MVSFVHIISILKYIEKMTNVTSTITYVIVIKYNFQHKIIQQYKSKKYTQSSFNNREQEDNHCIRYLNDPKYRMRIWLSYYFSL